MFNLSGSEIVFLLLIALVVLGPERLPDAMRRFGKTYSEVKKMSTRCKLGDGVFVAVARLVKHSPALDTLVFLYNIHAYLKILSILLLRYQIYNLTYHSSFGLFLKIKVFVTLLIDVIKL